MNVISLRKMCSLLLAVTLLLSMSIPVHADVVAATPQYSYGLNSVVDDQVQAQQMLRNEWETWKAAFVSTSGYRRIITTDGNNTVSEGMGYGLLLSVYFNEQTLFDELFDYVKNCYNSNGLMNWKTNNGIVVEQGADAEADQNIALALIFADKMWGSDGRVDYELEAKTLLGKIQMHECESNGQLRVTDSASERRNPSHLVPGWYEIFSAYSGSSYWHAVKFQAYNLLKYAANPTTGLVPDWCNSFGGLDTSNSSQGSNFGYEATRSVLKTAISYSWYGHTDAKYISSRQVNFFKNIGAANIVDGYRLTGTPVGNYHNAAFVACAAAGTMTGNDKQLAKEFYDECLATEGSDYYGSTLRLISLMYMTGNLQNLYANGKQISGTATTPTTTTPENTTPTGTAQPGASQGGASTGAGTEIGKNALVISNLPIAAILEGMGGTIEWNSTEQKATIRWNGTTVELWNGKRVISINGVKTEVDKAPVISTNTNKLMSPRFTADKTGCVISWESGSTKLTTAVNGLGTGDASNKIVSPQKNASAGIWDGLWSTDMGNMALLQSGDKVLGTYGEDEYSIEGTVSGNKLTCKYNDGGIVMYAEFSISADGLSFTGICGDANTPKSDWSQWNGKR